MSNNFPHQNTIQEFYIAYYGRPADPTGASFWSHTLENSSGNLNAIIGMFGNSDEFLGRFGDYSNSALIDSVYYQLFGRFPDVSGKQFYLQNLNSGNMSMQSIVINILDGAIGNDRTVIDSKVYVANYFMANLEFSDFDYRGNHAADSAKALMDQTTLDTTYALTRVDLLLGLDADVVDESSLELIDDYWIIEAGDSFSSAADIDDVVTIEGTAGFDFDSGDYFHFTASDDGIYHVESFTPNGELYIELRSSDGNLLATTVYQSDSAEDFLVDDLLAGEDFYLIVQPYAGEASDYFMTTWLEAYLAPEEYLEDTFYLGDAGDNLDNATYIDELNTWVTGSVGFDWDDGDYFYFYPEQTGYLEIELSEMNEDLDLTLYNAFGDVIQFSDNSADYDEQIVEWLYEDDLYFIEVSGYNNNASDYILDVWYA